MACSSTPELRAAYERIEELTTALRNVRDYLHQPRYAGETMAEHCTSEFLGSIEDVLAERVAP